MTTGEKRKVLDEFCEIHNCNETCPLYVTDLKCGRGEHFCVTGLGRMSDENVNLAYDLAFSNKEETPHIKDSGTRREFDTGAVRDIQEGKGRCDLMPLDVIGDIFGIYFSDHTGGVITGIADFQKHADVSGLLYALENFHDDSNFASWSDMFLEVAKHFEEGAKKYGEYNWQKGIESRSYIDSALRHYCKFKAGMDDEPHLTAALWNCVCCLWTINNKPELNSYNTDKKEK